jgi:hypothetical protein
VFEDDEVVSAFVGLLREGVDPDGSTVLIHGTSDDSDIAASIIV